MKIDNEHGFSIAMVRVDDDFFLKIVPYGVLNHEDYEKMVPMIESALLGIKEPKIKVLVDAREFKGWTLRAAWDDFKFGLKHSKEFQKIAFVGNKEYESYGVKISNWFMSGEMKYFDDIQSAIKWLNQKEKEFKDLDTVEKEFKERKDEIKSELKFLFKANMKITGWNIPEPNNQEAAKLLLEILKEGLDEIENDIKNGKFDY